MTPYDRLMAEAIPTGTFGDAQPTKPPQPHTARRWTTPEQLEHCRALLEALDGWEYAEERRLRAVADAA